MSSERFDVALVGGGGHIGAPLAILLASKGLRVLVQDIDRDAIATLSAGRMPFREEGAEPLLREALAARRLELTCDVEAVAGAAIVVLTIGTRIDEFDNPILEDILACAETLLPHLSDDQTLVLRSTVVPGVTEHLQRWLHSRGCGAPVAFCPERVVQGACLRELQQLPQIVSGTTAAAEDVAAGLFARVAPKIIRMTTREAELAKLFTNAYRYIQFAVSNQFYMLAQAHGLEYAGILAGMKDGYPRLDGLPGAGFAAGPCLYKDTVQLVASAHGRFVLGRDAIEINEGLPAFLVEAMRVRFPLRQTTIGLLGMAFKANSDDVRASLSYKLKKLLLQEAKTVLTSDPYVESDRDLLPLAEVVGRSDVLVLCVPHAAYLEADLGGKPVIDVWSFLPARAR